MAISRLLHTFSEQKWLLPYSKLKLIGDVLLHKYTQGNIDAFTKKLSLFDAVEEADPMATRMEGDTLIFPISGTLMPRVGAVEAMCGFVSTLDIKRNMLKALDATGPARMILHIDSGGGASTGIQELGNFINSLSKQIPMLAFSDTIMASGGFWLGAATGRIVATPSAQLGSVGVFRQVQKITEEGVETHIFQAGSKKTFGHPNIPMTEAEATHFQNDVELVMEVFLDEMARFRNISRDELKATQGSHGDAQFNSIFVDKIVMSIDELLN